MRQMSPASMVIRCFAVKENGQWVVCSLELGLAAQANTLPQAKRLLEAQLKDYVRSALVGEDKAHAQTLMQRKAPLSAYLTYYRILVLNRLHLYRTKIATVFSESMPLQPA